jgi:hypothetical protein
VGYTKTEVVTTVTKSLQLLINSNKPSIPAPTNQEFESQFVVSGQSGVITLGTQVLSTDAWAPKKLERKLMLHPTDAASIHH